MLANFGAISTGFGPTFVLVRGSALDGTLQDQALRHAATMPIAFDVQAERPFCCGLWKVQQFVGLLLGCSMFVAFATTRSIHTYPLANDMLGLTSLCACFWIFEVGLRQGTGPGGYWTLAARGTFAR